MYNAQNNAKRSVLCAIHRTAWNSHSQLELNSERGQNISERQCFFFFHIGWKFPHTFWRKKKKSKKKKKVKKYWVRNKDREQTMATIKVNFVEIKKIKSKKWGSNISLYVRQKKKGHILVKKKGERQIKKVKDQKKKKKRKF